MKFISGPMTARILLNTSSEQVPFVLRHHVFVVSRVFPHGILLPSFWSSSPVLSPVDAQDQLRLVLNLSLLAMNE